MRKEIIMCDKCKKEIKEEELFRCCFKLSFFELCERCHNKMKELKHKLEELDDKYKKEEQDLINNLGLEEFAGEENV